MTLIVDLVRAPRRSVATVRLRVTVPAGQVTITGETARESWTVGTYISHTHRQGARELHCRRNRTRITIVADRGIHLHG